MRAKRRGINLALWTDPEGGSCFSIYQISWIKIKKELFVNKRRHFVWVCLRTFQLTVFWGSFFLTILLQIQRENFFPPTSKQRQAKFCLFLGIFWAQLLQLPLKFHLSKLSRNEKPFWIPPQNSEYPRIFRVTGANQNAGKLLATDLVNTSSRHLLTSLS